MDEVVARLTEDLSQAAGGAVKVFLQPSHEWSDSKLTPLIGSCVDMLDVEITHYQPNPDLLTLSETATAPERVDGLHILYSDLLKSNCPVTNQPDWGTVILAYRGNTIDPASFLKYIVSFREQNGFHELCVEEIYCDVMQRCQPEELFVMARYTRRGGLDINPWRASSEAIAESLSSLREPFHRLARQ